MMLLLGIEEPVRICSAASARNVCCRGRSGEVYEFDGGRKVVVCEAIPSLITLIHSLAQVMGGELPCPDRETFVEE